MNIIKSISAIFSRGEKETFELPDPTEYRITTNTNEYLGTILHQDDHSIKFQSRKEKTVTILKSNINQMTMAQGTKNNALPIHKAKSKN